MKEPENLYTKFDQKLLRILDNQGYAWLPKQLTDFWEDIMRLVDGRSRITHHNLWFKKVGSEIYKEWNEDLWLIEDKGYKPYFVIEGQQLLTTYIILIQAIIEVALTLPENQEENKEEFEINHTSISEIRNDFICLKKPGTNQRSYIFGYEKDNPSYEFLRTKIFGEPPSSNQNFETPDAHNLENAKQFFIDKLLAFKEQERLDKLQSIYKNVTQQRMFN